MPFIPDGQNDFTPDAPKQTSGNPLADVPVLGGISNFAIGTGANIAKDLGTTLGINSTPGYQESQNKAIQASQNLGKRATTVTDPAERARMFKLAQQINQTTSGNAQNTAASFSPDVTQNPIARGIGGASEIAGTAGTVGSLPSIAKGAVGLVKNAGNLAKNTTSAVGSAARLLTSKGAIAAQKQAVSKGADISFNDLAENTLAKAGDKETPEFMQNIFDTLKRINPNMSDVTNAEKVATTQPGDYIANQLPVSTDSALSWRQQLDKEIPKTAWRDIGGATDAVRAKMTVRKVLDAMVKESAPGIKAPDKALSFMARLGGDVPTWAKRAAIAYGADRVGKWVGGDTGARIGDILAATRLIK